MTTPTETRPPCKDWCGTMDSDSHSPNDCYEASGVSPCWCSPGCRDAGRRLGDDPAEVVHYAGPGGCAVVTGSLATLTKSRVTCPACLTAMATTEPVSHGVGAGSGATRCGLPFTADLRLSAKWSRITCPACIAANPRVISGLDTAAATPESPKAHPHDVATKLIDRIQLRTYPQAVAIAQSVIEGERRAATPPARPSRVEVGHAWRVGRKLGRTLYRDGECVGIVDTRELAEQIVAAIGTVPVPVSAPTGEAPMPKAGCEHGFPVGGRACPYCELIRAAREPCTCNDCGECSRRAAAPGQSTPVETPPREVVHFAPDPESSFMFCGIDRNVAGERRWWTGDRQDRVTCTACLARIGISTAPAAPAPGAGEGPRWITFGEACEVQRRCPGRVETDGGDPPAWHTWEPLEPMSLLAVAEQSHWNYRMKAPEPLPAPAPRVSRAMELADMYRDVVARFLVLYRRGEFAPAADVTSMLLDALEPLLYGERG